MSRIERYQDGINTFVTNRMNIDDHYKKYILDSDHLLGIIISSIINFNVKKTNIKIHGYYIAAAIDLILLNINKNDIDILNEIYSLFHTNLDIIKFSQINENSIKIFKFSVTYFSNQIKLIFTKLKLQEQKRTNKTDVGNLNFKKQELKNKIKSINLIKQEDYESYINNKYKTLGELIFVMGWVMGGGEVKVEFMKELQIIGGKLGVIYKITSDFETIESDIDDNVNTNILLNYGIQESFTMFLDLKTEFLELLFKHNLYTHTIKEVLDLLENKIDYTLKKSNIDMKSTYSTYSSKTN